MMAHDPFSGDEQPNVGSGESIASSGLLEVTGRGALTLRTNAEILEAGLAEVAVEALSLYDTVLMQLRYKGKSCIIGDPRSKGIRIQLSLLEKIDADDQPADAAFQDPPDSPDTPPVRFRLGPQVASNYSNGCRNSRSTNMGNC